MMSSNVRMAGRTMIAWLIIATLAWTTAATAQHVSSSQNLLTNPDFEDDFFAWNVFYPGQTLISRTMNYRTADGMLIRSLELDSSEGGPPQFAFVLQCVDVSELTVYVAAAEVYSHCAGQQLHLFWADASCTVGDSVMAQSTHTDTWDRLVTFDQAPLGTQKAVVVLENPATCDAAAYFDAISLLPDHMFADGFERILPP